MLSINISIIVQKYVLFAVVVGIACVSCSQSAEKLPPTMGDDHWDNLTLEPASGLETPTVLQDAVIWHPRGEDVLIYQPLDTKRAAIRYEWIVGTPKQWMAIPAGIGERYQLIWLNTLGELWRAQVTKTGEQYQAPILVAGSQVTWFDAQRFLNGQMLLLWQTKLGQLKSVSLAVVDEWGRPVRERIILRHAEQVAMALDDNIHLVWLLQNQLYYGVFELGRLFMNTELALFAANQPIEGIEASAWIESLHIVMSGNAVITMWEMVDIRDPSYSTIEGFVWRESEVSAFELSLSDTKIRWLRRVENDHLALTAFLGGVWRPVLITFENGEFKNYRVISNYPANASAVQLWISPQGSIIGAWGWIDEDYVIRVQVVVEKT